MLSRTAVSRVTERLWQEYEAFATSDLSEFAVAYLFIDGVAEQLHAGALCDWGITENGRKLLLHLAPGTREDMASCTAFFEDVKRRACPIRSWRSPTRSYLSVRNCRRKPAVVAEPPRVFRSLHSLRGWG